MKKIIIMTLSLWQISNTFGQTAPLGTFPNNNTNYRAGSAWYRGGNLAITTNPPGDQIFGGIM
jgi:hypothetical protein